MASIERQRNKTGSREEERGRKKEMDGVDGLDGMATRTVDEPECALYFCIHSLYIYAHPEVLL